MNSPLSLLKSIKSPDDVKRLPFVALSPLADQVRAKIIEVVAQNGGHLGPNLGVVELTIALHRVFSTPHDLFTFDVAHQGYVHKLLTGRNGPEFSKLRKTGGVSGFLMRHESKHDAYGAGHAGTALSAALGMAVARDRTGEKNRHVVAVLGDAAFTCGITMEALNNVRASTNRLIVILNDNKWSISKNVGALSHYFNELITSRTYNQVNNVLGRFLNKIPGGRFLTRIGSKLKKETKDVLSSSSFFENYGLRYIGPIDGHNLKELVQYLEFCKELDEPVLLHVVTEKGRGCPFALENPEKFHGAGPFNPETGKASPAKQGCVPKYQDVFGEAMVRFAKEDPKVIGITAATAPGTSLSLLAKEVPEQFFDVGIAEEHAALFAAGLATQGFTPVFAVYSTFLQRAYDPVIHDICLQRLPVVFCLDRAGLSSPDDGPTHHGIFDFSVLRSIPHAVIMQPSNEDELVDMMYTGLKLNAPVFIRYPKGKGIGVEIKAIPALISVGKAEVVAEGDDIAIWALGPTLQDALAIAHFLKLEAGLSVSVVNARFVKPLDVELLKAQCERVRLVVTLEDNVAIGGFGGAVLEALQENGILMHLERIGWPDKFIEHASSVDDIKKDNELDVASLVRRILVKWNQVEVLSEKESWQTV